MVSSKSSKLYRCTGDTETDITIIRHGCQAVFAGWDIESYDPETDFYYFINHTLPDHLDEYPMFVVDDKNGMKYSLLNGFSRRAEGDDTSAHILFNVGFQLLLNQVKSRGLTSPLWSATLT